MYSTTNKNPEPPGVVIWVLVTLLWGTVFFLTSIFMLSYASMWLGQGVFDLTKKCLVVAYINIGSDFPDCWHNPLNTLGRCVFREKLQPDRSWERIRAKNLDDILAEVVSKCLCSIIFRNIRGLLHSLEHLYLSCSFLSLSFTH